MFNSKQNHKKKLTLEDCLNKMTEKDDLDELNKWFCPNCKTFVHSQATLSIWSVPDVLILHLKRFVERDGTFKKVSSFVEFPTTLDMMPFIVGPQRVETSQESGETDQKGQQIYKLYATINHSGILESGHYTANIFSEHQNKWYILFSFISDKKVRIFNELIIILCCH